MTNRVSRQAELEALLKSFHLTFFRSHYEQFARQAEKEKLDHVAYLYQLCKLESDERYNRRTEKLIKQSKIPRAKLLSSFEFGRFEDLSESEVRQLSEGAFMDLSENILIFGNPGTGKSHLAAALGREWCLRGRTTFYTTASALVQRLLIAKRDLKLNKMIKDLDAFEALIIDDISYVPQDRDETDVLFVLLAERYERRSLVITSNLQFSDWNLIFKDAVTTMAAIDKLVHHGHVLELNGDSYRAGVAEERKNRKKASKPVKD